MPAPHAMQLCRCPVSNPEHIIGAGQKLTRGAQLPTRQAMRALLRRMRVDLFDGQCVQVLSLGAGFDSTFWTLAAAGDASLLRYVEVDFPTLARPSPFFVLGLPHVTRIE